MSLSTFRQSPGHLLRVLSRVHLFQSLSSKILAIDWDLELHSWQTPSTTHQQMLLKTDLHPTASLREERGTVEMQTNTIMLCGQEGVRVERQFMVKDASCSGSLVYSTHVRRFPSACNSRPSRSDAFFWPPKAFHVYVHICMHMHAHIHTYTHTEKDQNHFLLFWAIEIYSW